MEFHLFCLLITLISSFGVLASSMSSLSPEMFWSKALPNTPMPKMIKDMLESNEKTQAVHKKHRDPKLDANGCRVYFYNYANTEDQVKQYKQKYGQTFMLKKDMTPGSTVKILWTPTAANTNSIDKISFLPRHVADSIPFSSDKLPDILNLLSINPKSEAAQVMKDSLKDCELKDYSKGGEQKYCSTSLENMITFSTSKLGGNDVRALTSVTKVDKDSRIVGQTEFEIVGVKTEVEYGLPMVVCHRQSYPYAVFLCHKTRMTAAYTVSLVGGGMKVNALAICHGDSSWWNPKTYALQVLKVKPGTTTPICHFLEEGNLLWAKE